jgi:hypothetical protein
VVAKNESLTPEQGFGNKRFMIELRFVVCMTCSDLSGADRNYPFDVIG